MRTDSTVAKIGRSMKNLEKMAVPSHSLPPDKPYSLVPMLRVGTLSRPLRGLRLTTT
jgi:hypothetical protein